MSGNSRTPWHGIFEPSRDRKPLYHVYAYIIQFYQYHMVLSIRDMPVMLVISSYLTRDSLYSIVPYSAGSYDNVGTTGGTLSILLAFLWGEASS